MPQTEYEIMAGRGDRVRIETWITIVVCLLLAATAIFATRAYWIDAFPWDRVSSEVKRLLLGLLILVGLCLVFATSHLLRRKR